MSSGFKLDSGWKTFSVILQPERIKRRLKKEVSKANTKIGRVVRKQIREEIKSGNYDKSAGLTVAINHSKKPLRGIYKHIKVKKLTWNMYFIGVKKDNEQFQLLKAVHDGSTIGVTDKMRTMFRMLWFASKGSLDPARLTGRAGELWKSNQTWYPLRSDTSSISIPERPFIENAFKRSELKLEAKQLWENAIQESLIK